MRILFINAFESTGGAAKIASRLMKGLAEYYGTENHYLVRYKKSSDNKTQTTVSTFFEKAIERSLGKVTDLIGMQYLFYPFSSKKILQYAREIQPDIISLHNTHGGYFATPLLSKLSKIAPVVWTLHDMWSFTGNAAHTFGNTSWKQLKNDPHLRKIEPAIGINTGARLLRMKKKIYQQSDITLVSPSIWLASMARESPVFEGKKIIHIYNGVDESVFQKKDKFSCRKKLGLPSDGKVIMFSAENISIKNPWKGGDHLLQILSRINQRSTVKISLLMIGTGQLDELARFDNFRVFNQGYIKNEQEMCDALNAVDILIYPTKADNLPNILVEAIACGTPCITFNIGGNNEIIINNSNGYIIEPFNFDDFADKTISLLNEPEKLRQFSDIALKEVQNKFKLKHMTDAYYKLFSTIKGNPDVKGN
jgi:glycosyltransferase involved in cell wall biosynthesis